MELLFYPCLLGFFFLLFVPFSLQFLLYLKQKKNLPPGRTGFPIIGETLEFLSTGWKGHPEKFIFDRIAKYSSYVFKTSLVGSPAVVLCGSAGNKFLFSNENKLVQVWWPSSIEKIFPSFTQKSSKEESIKLRKMLKKFFKPEVLQVYIGLMDQIAERHFATDWENEGDQVVVVFPLTRRYTFWVACRVFVSLEDPIHIAKFEHSFECLLKGIFSVPVNLPGTPFNRAIKAANFIRKELVTIINQRKIDLTHGKASPTQDILSHMLHASDEDGKFMEEAYIADKILGLLIGGHDTVSSCCASIVKYLAELPEIYEGVYKEQMEIVNSKTEGEQLNWEDINKMKYSWNVACEVMRLVPPVQGNFREAITDFTYDGFSIPKGWKIYWSAHSTHRNKEFFPEPLKFDPSRFDGSGPAPYTFVPFGGGPRMCPGKEYARMEILVFMHHLVRRFKWEMLIPNEKIISDPLPNPEKGLPIRLFPHAKA